MFKVAPPGHEHVFDFTPLDMCVPCIPDDLLRQALSSQPSDSGSCGQCVMAAYRRLSSGGSLFSRLPCVVANPIWSLLGSMHDAVLCLVNVLEPSGIVPPTLCLATSVLLHGLANVNAK